MVAQLRSAAAAATEQLRSIIDVLRNDEDEDEEASRDATRIGPAGWGRADALPAGPLGASIADLVRRASAAGMPVRLHQDGSPDPAAGTAAGRPPTMLDRAAYRVVQESLTNANKHAPGAPVTVRLWRDATGTTISVRNDPPGDRRRTDPRISGGCGLVGLHERVRLVGGTLRAGPSPDGGFEVVARLPREPRDEPRVGPVTPEPTGDNASPVAHRRRLVHREARRSLVAATAVLAALTVTLSGGGVGYYLYATSNSVLSPERYDKLRPTQPLTEIEPLLPRRELLDPPKERLPPEPAGADCRYYRSHGNVLRLQLNVYRLCFVDGRLVVKDVIPHP